MAFSLVCLFRKSRIPSGEGKRITPFVLGCAMLLYGILYLSGIPAVRWWFGDMNVMFCLLYAAIYEKLYPLPYDTVQHGICGTV